MIDYALFYRSVVQPHKLIYRLDYHSTPHRLVRGANIRI